MGQHVRLLISIFIAVFVFASSLVGQSPKKGGTDARIVKLESTVKRLSDRVILLEAIISGLNKENGTIAEMHYHYVLATRDGIINDLFNIGSNAYQYKIRPTTMGGGGGSYLNYSIPKAFPDKKISEISVAVSPDSIILTAKSKEGLGTIQATMSDKGEFKNFIFTGEFE